jgi:hypothetical protein
MPKNTYTVEMEEPVMVGVGFSSPEDALRFVSCCGVLAADEDEPDEKDIAELIRALRDSAKSFGIFPSNDEMIRRIKATKAE